MFGAGEIAREFGGKGRPAIFAHLTSALGKQVPTFHTILQLEEPDDGYCGQTSGKSAAGLKGLGVAPSTGLVLFHLASQRCDYQLDVFEWRSKVRTLSAVTTRAGMQALTCKWSN
jgi:hypothetical protein